MLMEAGNKDGKSDPVIKNRIEELYLQEFRAELIRYNKQFYHYRIIDMIESSKNSELLKTKLRLLQKSLDKILESEEFFVSSNMEIQTSDSDKIDEMSNKNEPECSIEQSGEGCGAFE